MRRALRLASLLLVFAWTVTATGQSPAAVEWVKANAIPLTTPAAGNGFADMQRLKAIVGASRIVSLGEATHGSREFFQLKHRMLEFLATEMGFTIFSIEANMPEAYRLNDYVLNGTGDPAQLLRGLYFWTWDTEEVLAMIQWMREFNASGRGRLQFTGFDMQTPTVAATLVRDFAAARAPDLSATVAEASAAAARAQTTSSGSPFGVVSGQFPVAAAAGKRIRFSAQIKTANVAGGYAGLWWRVNGEKGVLAFDNMSSRGAQGTTDWKKYEIDLPVDAAATSIVFGALMPGTGTAWFDDLAVEIDGQPYADARFDFGFESGSIRGLFGGGAGYQVGVDAAVARTGTHSLRISSTTASALPGAATAETPKATAIRWQDILSRLESGRAGYRSQGAADREIDWAIQNARVVLQCMQMRSNEVSRDRSMAANVKWIADQNPGAKMVLWAHNGHAARGGFGFETMGAALRQMFGADQVVFGFAFNEGSFQAIPQGGGSLRNFTVPPAKPDSLDGALAASGIPIFSIDLRQAPAFFREPHGSRQIGAAYPDGETHAFVMDLRATDAYDAMLFVNTTTAARKNPGR